MSSKDCTECDWRLLSTLVQFLNHRVLVVNRKLRVTNDVDEEDMRDFELIAFLTSTDIPIHAEMRLRILSTTVLAVETKPGGSRNLR